MQRICTSCAARERNSTHHFRDGVLFPASAIPMQAAVCRIHGAATVTPPGAVSRIFLGVKQLTSVDQPLDYSAGRVRLAAVWNAN
jgi:hypothetical protein